MRLLEVGDYAQQFGVALIELWPTGPLPWKIGLQGLRRSCPRSGYSSAGGWRLPAPRLHLEVVVTPITGRRFPPGKHASCCGLEQGWLDVITRGERALRVFPTAAALSTSALPCLAISSSQ